ncbi:MAG: VOC family protein [Dokdonia sp.]|jgi:catechol 2,3-dioxygenase-like lactoylglutathione lyase family enzyme|nr:glyoxalase [Cytophagaceae bacterium]
MARQGRLWLIFATVVFAFPIYGQTKVSFDIDHFAINVSQLEQSVSFYQKIFKLTEITNGTNNPKIRWFRLGDDAELHIIEVDTLDKKIPKGVHLALAVSDLDRFRESLHSMNITYSDWPGKEGALSTRPDGIRQLYLQDPDGYYIEVNDAKH